MTRQVETTASAQAASAPSRRPWLLPLALVGSVVVLGLLPFLRSRDFYFWDDSAAVFLPTWRAAGQDLLSGRWPALRPDFWMGGNWAVEAQFGLWSPVNLLLMMVVAVVGDLAVAALVVKIGFQLLLASGTYALAREYGASRWPAWAVAATLPFAGFTLYYDTSTWVAGLMAFAWLTWFWWAARRCGRGALNPIVTFVIGYLLITNGNPYGALGAVLVLLGQAIELALARRWRGLGRLVVVGALVGLTVLVAFLPLVLSSDAGWRESEGIVNDGFLVPDLTMLAASSTPGFTPFIRVWSGSGTTVPLAYSAWFLLPLLPWLRWGELKRDAARFAGLITVFVAYLALTLGPSSLWLFRWPARLLEYVWLPTFVLLAVLVSRGLQTSAWRTRTVVTAVIVLGGTWLAWSATPQAITRTGASLLLHGGLAALLVLLAVRWRSWLPGLMVAGSAVVLAFQLAAMPLNMDVAKWYFPSTPAQLDAYAERVGGPVVQIAVPDLIPLEERPSDWLLFGSMPGATGVESTTSYTGIGNDEFSMTLCLNHAGANCRQALGKAFDDAGQLVEVPHLVDALKARTIVVQNALVRDVVDFDAPSGWERAEADDEVTVFRRTTELPWPDSRLAAVSPGVTVVQATSTDAAERVRVSTGPDGGALLFARLAWPGYWATVAGLRVEVVENAQGLLEVPLPPGLQDADVAVEFAVPGYQLAVPLLVVALAGAIAMGVLWNTEGARRGRASEASRRAA